jgi:valyl-tRNA synthetase
VFVFLADLVDLEKEREKKTAEIQRLETLIDNLELKLRNRDFRARAPEAIVNKEKEKLAGYRQTADKLRQTIEGMR